MADPLAKEDAEMATMLECDVCGQNHTTEECPMLGLSTSDFKAQISRARLTVPHYLGVIDYTDGEVGIMAMEPISNKTQLGPFEAKKTCHCPLDDVFILKILSADGNTICLDTSSENQCNWMALVQVARTVEEQNCMAYQLGINIYFSTTRDVPSGTPLRVWYASKYAQKLGKPPMPDGKTHSMLGMDISDWQSEDPPVQPSSSEGLIEAASYLSSILPSGASSPDSIHTILLKDEATTTSHQIYSCSKCSQMFLSQNDYAIHLRGHLMPASLLSQSGRTGRRGRPWGRVGVVTPLGRRGPGRPRKNAVWKEPGEVVARTPLFFPYKKRGRPRKIAPDGDSTYAGSQSFSEVQDLMDMQLADASQLSDNPAASTAGADDCEDSTDKPTAPGVALKEGTVDEHKYAEEDQATVGSVPTLGTNMCPESASTQHGTDGQELQSAGPMSRPSAQHISADNAQPVVKEPRRRGRPPKSLTKCPSAGEANSSPTKAASLLTPPCPSSSRRVQPRRTLKGKRTSTFRYPGESSSDDDDDDDDGKTKGKNVLKQALRVKEYSDDDDDYDDGGLEPGEMVVGRDCGVQITVQTPDGMILSKAPIILLQGDTDHAMSIQQDMLSLVTGVDSSGQQVVVLQSTQSASLTTATAALTHDPGQGDSISAVTHDARQGDITCAVEHDPGQGDITPTAETHDPGQGDTTTPSEDNDGSSSQSQQRCGGQDGLATLVDAALASHSLGLQDREHNSMQRTVDDDEGVEDDLTSDDPDWKGPVTVKKDGLPRKRRPKRRKGDDPSLEMLEESVQVLVRPDGSQEFACGVCMKHFQQLKYLKMHLPAHTDKFLCNDCGRRFARHESLQKHVCDDWLVLVEKIRSEEDGSITFRCKECGRSFPQMDHARRHASMHRGTWACAKCQHTFPKRQLLLEHKCLAQEFPDGAADTGGDDSSNTNITAPSGDNNSGGEGDGGEGGELLCDICRQTFSCAKYLFRHMAMHTELFQCRACSKCYSRKDSLQRHVLKCCPQLADDYSVFSCDKCKKTFGTRLGLENHVLNCGKFQCSECRIAFFSEDDLTQHKCEGRVIDEATGVQFPCKECGKTFASLPYLARHEASHHAAFECQVCKKVFVRGEELSWHQPVCEGASQIEQDGVTSCQVCQTQFTDVRLFREHFQVHTHPYRCDKCGKRFIKVGTLHTHKCDNVVSSTTGEEDGVCQCDICEKTFKNERYLARHKQLHGVPSFDCEYCSKKFIRKDYLSDHKCVLPDGTPVRVVRKKNRLYIRDDLVCPHCNKTFSSRSNLNKHLRVHGDKEAECHICGKRFHYHSYLKLHIATVHDRQYQYQCSHCGKILFSKTGLIAHIKQFHQETVKLYPCPKCGKTFRQKGNMRTHLYSHTKERTFQCELCSKAFKYPDQLNRHRLEHTMNEKIKCHYCDKRFVRASELRQHERLFHSGVIYTCHVCHESCAHKHTIMRHYRRKHPEVADIFEKQPDFLDTLQKAVDKVTSVGAQRMAIQLEAPGRSSGDHKPRIIRVLNDGGEEQEYIITTTPTTSTIHDAVVATANNTVEVGEGGLLPFNSQQASHVLPEEAIQVLQDMSGAVYETDGSGVITQTMEDADGNQTVIILQVVNQDELGATEVAQMEGDNLAVQELGNGLATIEVPMEIGTTEGAPSAADVDTIGYTTDMDTADMEPVIISAADVNTAHSGTITLVARGLTSAIMESAAAMETEAGVIVTNAAMERESVVDTLEVPQVDEGEGSEHIVHYL